MATKVKPSRLNVTWTPQAWQVPVYVDADNFQWWAGWWWSWDVTWPASSTDGNLAVFDWVTWKLIKDGWAVPTSFAPWWTATTWYVVTKTANGYEWAAPSGWDVVVSSDSDNVLTTWAGLWAWTESDYTNLWTYDSNTLYFTY